MISRTDKKYFEEVEYVPKPHWSVRCLFAPYPFSVLPLSMNILRVLEKVEVIDKIDIIEALLLPQSLIMENKSCLMASVRPVENLSALKKKWAQYEFKVLRSVITIKSEDERIFHIAEFFNILKEMQPTENTIIGVIEASKNVLEIFSKLRSLKLYHQSVMGEFTSFCYVQDNGYTLFGRDKSLGPWAPEIEALIERDQSKL